MWENLVMATLMIVFAVWCIGSVLFSLLVWPKIARRINEVNGLDKEDETYYTY